MRRRLSNIFSRRDQRLSGQTFSYRQLKEQQEREDEIERNRNNQPVIQNYWPNPNPKPPPKMVAIPDLQYASYNSKAKNAPDRDYVELDKPFFRQNYGFQIGKQIARGGFGAVYEGVVAEEIVTKKYRIPDITKIDPNVERVSFEVENGQMVCYVEKNLYELPFAVKYMFTDYNNKEILNELQVLVTLEHPNVVDVYAVHRIFGEKTFSFSNGTKRVYIFMEMAEHGSLFDFFYSAHNILTDELCIDFIRQLITGLTYIHSLNIVHYDLKSMNILVFKGNAEHQYILKYADFGVSELNCTKFVEDLKRLAPILKDILDHLAPDTQLRDCVRDLVTQLKSRAFQNCQEFKQYLKQNYPFIWNVTEV